MLPGKEHSPSYVTLLGLCCGLAFASYVGSYMRIPMVPLFAGSLGASTVEIGLINSLFLLVAGIFAFPLGLLSDRWGRKPLIAGGLLLSMSTALMLAVSQTPGQIMVIYFIFGLGLAAVGPTLMSYVADISPTTHLGRSYGWYTTAIYGGMSLGPALGGGVAEWLGFRLLFLASAGFLLVIFGLALALLPKGPATQSQTGKPRESAKPRWREVWRNRPLLGCWLATLGGCFGLGMFVTFAPLHTHNQGIKVGQIGLIFGVQAASNALCRIPFGRLTDLVEIRWRPAMLGLICFGATMAGFGISRTYAQFILAAILLGLSMGLAFTPIGALVAETARPESRGLAMGGYNTCIYLGMMLSSAIMGAVVGKVGFARSFLLTAGCVFLSAVGFYLLIRDFSPGGRSGSQGGVQ